MIPTNLQITEGEVDIKEILPKKGQIDMIQQMIPTMTMMMIAQMEIQVKLVKNTTQKMKQHRNQNANLGCLLKT